VEGRLTIKKLCATHRSYKITSTFSLPNRRIKMGDKGKKDKDKHNKQVEQAKNEAKKKQEPKTKY
jgi:beta-lactamase class D